MEAEMLVLHSLSEEEQAEIDSMLQQAAATGETQTGTI